MYLQGLYDQLPCMQRDYPAGALYIMGNEAAYDDRVSDNGRRVHDAASRLVSTAPGSSSANDYQWRAVEGLCCLVVGGHRAFGYLHRFGITWLDDKIQQQIKDHGYLYRDIIAADATAEQ